MADDSHFEEIKKMPYLINSLTGHHEIWLDDAK